jgi:hypothetical protein
MTTRSRGALVSEFSFIVRVALPRDIGSEEAVDRLVEVGCDDAVIGSGQHGRLALAFDRRATDAPAALSGALEQIARALPGSVVVEVGPDLVSLSDIAMVLGCSRQNARKLLVGAYGAPAPVHEGSTGIWHLAPVLDWLAAERGYRIAPELRAVAAEARRHNAIAEHRAAVSPR